ncbi:hypothetical protein N431DRAFT_556485 [Stipitochalara longipes BDJ]|nr:hypothetical protein N431DRAFT_556485 [Stipitochalara longipes BDJ]
MAARTWIQKFTQSSKKSATSPLPSSITATFKGTPVKSSSSRLADSESRHVVERELFFEIKDCTFRNVAGFVDKFFNLKGWRKEQEMMLKGVMIAHDGKKWKDFPVTPDEKPVWDWFRSLEDRFLPDAPHKLHTTKTANQFKDRKGQMDLFFQMPAKQAGPVFTDQLTRRYVHGFLLCASIMEQWIFDRSGPYSSGTFDTHEEPEKFARALVGYATMDHATMGLDTFIEREHGHHCVTLNDSSGRETSIRLGRPIVRQKAVVYRGTTCERPTKALEPLILTE